MSNPRPPILLIPRHITTLLLALLLLSSILSRACRVAAYPIDDTARAVDMVAHPRPCPVYEMLEGECMGTNGR